jgi:hypothetical protein
LIEGGTHRGGTTFAKVGDTVLRVSSELERHSDFDPFRGDPRFEKVAASDAPKDAKP